MSLSEIQPKRTAHTLFIDFVGYSRLSANSQAAVQIALQNLVYNLPAFQVARNEGQLMVRKTGDGMAIVFFQDIEYPLAAAVALDEVIKHQAAALREQVGANFRLRQGIHSGPVVIVDEDGDGVMDVAGEGINTAQRVMDCGDQGHILVSAAVFHAVAEHEHWKTLLHDLGIVRVKHDELVHLYNLHGVRPDGTMIGFEAIPHKIHESHERAKELAQREEVLERQSQRTTITGYALRAAVLLAALVAVGAVLWSLWSYRATDDIAKVREAIKRREAEKARLKNPTPAPGVVTVATPAPKPLVKSDSIIEANVPNLVGMQRAAAEVALVQIGLTLALSENTPEVINPTVPPNTIVNQSPAAGPQKVKGGVVYVSVAAAGTVAPTPAAPQSTYTGVLIDARSFAQLANQQSAGLFGPDESPLYSAAGITDDELQAVQAVGANPLRLTAAVAGPNGVGLSQEDVAKLRALPNEIRAKTVVLRP